MNNVLAGAAIWAAMEVVANIVFAYLRKRFEKPSEEKPTLFMSVFKGVLERALLYLALLNNVPTVIVMFGAIKLGTRLDSKEKRISNDYFLVGNFISVLIVIVAYAIFSELKG